MKIEEYTEYFSSSITEGETFIDQSCKRLYGLGMKKAIKHFTLFASFKFNINEDKLIVFFTDFIENEIEEKSILL